MSTPDVAVLLRRLRIPGQVTIGLAGGSGAGKSTLAAAIAARLAPLRVQVVGLDRFFKPAAELPRYRSAHHGEDRADYNRPDSLRVDAMVAACSQPADADVVILDGHLLLCYEQMRRLLDVKVFVDAGLEEMLARRTARNLANGYGGGLDTILPYNRECVVPGYEGHILPSRVHADLVLPNAAGAEAERDRRIEALCAAVAARLA